jgi:hypothetical protein
MKMMTGNPSGQLSLLNSHTVRWQTIIWREWCRSKDEDYAFYLYNLVKSTALGWKFVAAFTLLGALCGVMIGYLLGSMLVTIFDPQTTIWNLAEWSPLILGWVMSVTGGLIGVEASRGFRTWYFWWQGQPPATKVEQALQLAATLRPEMEDVWAEPLRRLQEEKEQPGQPDQYVAALQSQNWIDRFTARQNLIALGGAAVEALRELAGDKTNPLWQTAIWLLAGIEHETANRFARRVSDLTCPHCLARFDARPVQVSVGVSFTYYGCRICGQSREFIYHPRGIIAILDRSRTEALIHQDGVVRVNWLARRELFDFDQVELIQATDEEIERFAVQVGNDTDPFRKSRYEKMRCLIGPACQLSENTRRILRRMFGKVVRANKLADRNVTASGRTDSQINDPGEFDPGEKIEPVRQSQQTASQAGD